ncbi:MAG: hypothetical protein RR478_00135 [Bacilli bacterium]
MKKIVFVISLLLLFTGCCKTSDSNDVSLKLKEIGITDLTVVDNYKIPEFKIDIKGKITSIINEEVVKNLDVFEIKAIVDDGFNKSSKTYNGIKLNDALKEITEDTNYIAYITDNEKLTIGYLPDELNENMFIVFDKDNKVTVTKFDRKTYNWVRNANVIDLSVSFK